MLEVSVFLDQDDRYEQHPADEHIVRYLMHHGIMGASVFTGSMGFGRKHHLHHPRTLGTVDECPVMILFIDEEEKVLAVLPHIKEVVREGLIVSRRVDRI
jgi:PII-like signaling protein